MKNLLLATALLLFGLCPAYAQSGPALGAPATSPAHGDSVAVLHQLFRKARQNGRFGTISWGVWASTISYGIADGSYDGRHNTGLKILGGAAGLGEAALAIATWARFSRRREVLAVRQFEEGQPLPPYLQQRFKRLFAREMARQHRF